MDRRLMAMNMNGLGVAQRISHGKIKSPPANPNPNPKTANLLIIALEAQY